MSRASTLTGDWRTLADRLGGAAELAAELQVSPATLYRWARGSPPGSKFARDHANAFFRRRGLAAPFEET